MSIEFSDIFSLVVGAILAVAVAAIVESLRRPSLRLTVTDNLRIRWAPPRAAGATGTSEDIHCGCFANVRVENEANAPQWMIPATAERCRASVQFFNEERSPLLGDHHSMRGRWGSAAEPIPVPFPITAVEHHATNGFSVSQRATMIGYMPDFLALSNQEMSIEQGKYDIVNVVAQFDDDEDCFGWCNDVYTLGWKMPERRIGPGSYHVKVTIETMGVKFARWFRLVNSGHRDHLAIQLLEEVESNI